MLQCRVLCCCVALALPQFVLADLPFANGIFGQLEGTLAFCAQVNPKSAAQYQAQAALLVKDVPPQELSRARESAEYREAYDSMAAQLAKVSKGEALKACSGSLAAT